jgi:hypothetical protein
MLKRVVHLTVASLLPLLALACATGDEDGTTFGGFTSGPTTTTSTTNAEDDMSETSDEGDDAETGDGDPTTGDPTGDGDGDPTTGDGDGDPTTGDGDGDPTTGDGDGDPGPNCGNGVIDPGETCDGNDFGGVTCVDLGYDGGTLTCTNCAASTATCSNTPQPGLGQLYSNCLTPDQCPGLDGCATVSMEGETDPFDGFCTNFCITDADCFANTGGNAVPQCNDAADPYCELDCAGGKTCPGGMVCTPISGGKQLCY